MKKILQDEEKEKGHNMFDSINNVVGKINGAVWGWPMIILLFGTHVFLTIRTGFIQRKTISKGIKLSVAKDPDAEGEVSQFGALTTALAATIGTGNIIGVGTAIALGGSWSGSVDLAYRCIWNRNEICGVSDRC